MLPLHNHLQSNDLQFEMNMAFRKAAIPSATCDTFAMYYLEPSTRIRTIQDLLGHKDVGTTPFYSFVMQNGGF